MGLVQIHVTLCEYFAFQEFKRILYIILAKYPGQESTQTNKQMESHENRRSYKDRGSKHSVLVIKGKQIKTHKRLK